jgi:hypothetical protein
VSVGSGKKMVDGERTDTNCLVFTPTAKLKPDEQVFTPIPPVIRYHSINGRDYDIPTDVRPSGSKIRAAGNPALLCDNTVPKRPGCSISRNSSNHAGTLGIKVFKNGNSYLLSCYHVLCNPELQDGQMSFSALNAVGSTKIVSPAITDGKDNQNVGVVVEGVLDVDNSLDCAIAQIEDPFLVAGDFCTIDTQPGIPIAVSEADEGKISLIGVGRTSGVLKGTVEHAVSHCIVEYTINGKAQDIRLDGLICTNLDVQGGDSGAIVLDNNTKNVVGMIVAASDDLSYLIPINRILKKFSVTLK